MKQNDNEKQRYEAPRLTAVSFRTERGFAGSGDRARIFEFMEGGGQDNACISEQRDQFNASDVWSW